MAQSRVKRSVIWLHKWLGVVLALFFAMWFASGIVLYFVPFPTLTEEERLSGKAAIVLPDACCLSAAQAADQAGLHVTRSRLGMWAGRPVWRVLGAVPGESLAWRMLDARTGALLPALDSTQAGAVAQAFSGQAVLHVEKLDRDQWTVPQGLNPYRPLYKVSLAGDDGLQLYISAGAGEVVRDTRRTERFWNWLGAVPHWIYPTVLRAIPRLWHHVVVWLSLLGVLVALTGCVLGLWQLFLNRRRWIPYRVFWLRWHHITGLVAALFTFTWMLSGLFSMNPFALFSAQSPTPVEVVRWREAKTPEVPITPATGFLPVQHALHLAMQDGMSVREVSVLRIAGQSWYMLRDPERHVLVRADASQTPVLRHHLPDALMIRTLTQLRDTVPVRIRVQNVYDGEYYTHAPHTHQGRWQRPLPVLRAQWDDGVRVYADPASGRIVLRTDTSSRWERVLYKGLHSLDFAPLLRYSRLRDTLVVGLSLLGLAMCLTACVLSWRVLFPRKRRAGV